MPLLLDEDYTHLNEIGQSWIENEDARFLILKEFPLPGGVYVAGGIPRDSVDVLYIVPQNYNTEGGDMFWVHPQLSRADGVAIPNISGSGQDSRTLDGVEYLRWSRHWNNRPWKPKLDNVRTVIDRLNWAFANPDAKR